MPDDEKAAKAEQPAVAVAGTCPRPECGGDCVRLGTANIYSCTKCGQMWNSYEIKPAREA